MQAMKIVATFKTIFKMNSKELEEGKDQVLKTTIHQIRGKISGVLNEKVTNHLWLLFEQLYKKSSHQFSPTTIHCTTLSTSHLQQYLKKHCGFEQANFCTNNSVKSHNTFYLRDGMLQP